jgi:glycosyltransferase involved in cell wall biosynthesis
MKIAAFTDHWFTPSSRFRIRQYIPFLESNGIEVHDYAREYSTQTVVTSGNSKRIRESFSLIFKAVLHESSNLISRLQDSIESNESDAVWLSRQLVIGYPTFEILLRKPLIYDIDDAIFLSGKLEDYQFRLASQRATTVVAGNEYLAEEASKYNKNVHVIPTSVDTQRWKPLEAVDRHQDYRSGEFTVGWSGTSSSFKYFFPLEREIAKFIINNPSVKLVFMADRFPKELQILKPFVSFIEWSAENEVQFIQSLNVGLMPIANDMWAMGKCAYKCLLYAACGIPVVMTPVGVNKKILSQSDVGIGPNSPSEWYEALQFLFDDQLHGRQLGGNGVHLIEREYSLEVCAPRVMSILRQSL